MSFLCLCLISFLIILLIFWYRQTYDYWSSRNVNGPKPYPVLGTIPYLMKYDMHTSDRKLYNKYGKIYGEYFGTTPHLVVADLNLAKQILVTDFNRFRQSDNFPILPDLYKTLILFAPIDDWKRLRSAVTPAFTSGKLRRSLGHLKVPMQTFLRNLDEQVRQGKACQISVKHLTKAFSMDSISKYVFAMDIDSFKQRSDPYVKYMWRLINIPPTPFLLSLLLPKWLSGWLKGWMTDLEACNFFSKLNLEIIKERRANPQLKYDDHLDLLLENPKLSEQEILGSCLIFFFAGVDTISSVLAIILSDLAIHQNVQERLLNEIREKIDHEELTYDKINELEYLNGVIFESTRKTPISGRLVRHNQSNYQLPGTNIILEPNTTVWINAYNIHHDEEIYPQADQFRPERFMKEEKQNLIAHAWLSFSDGPRNCAGIRLALLHLKYFLINLIKSYEIHLSKGCHAPIIYNSGIFLSVPDSLKIEFIPRNT